MSPVAEPENGYYSRRRIDELMDQRISGIETTVGDIDKKVDALSQRLAIIAGGLTVVSFVLNIVGPIVVREFLAK